MTLCDPMDCSPPGSSRGPWNFPGKNTGVGKPFPSPGDLPKPGIQPGSHALQGDSLPSEPPEVYFEDLRAGILHHSSLCHQHVS